MIFILFLIGGRYIFILPGILILIACIAWLYIRKKEITVNKKFSNKIILILSSSFFFLFTLSMLIFVNRSSVYERPIEYFLILSVMVGVIFLEVTFSNRRCSPLILLQIFALSINMTWSEVLLYPTIIGIDTWWHQENVNLIISTGFIPTWGNYSMEPIFHLIIGITEISTGLNYQYSSILSVSFAQTVCGILMVYLISRLLFRNEKMALFSSLLLACANLWIFQNIAPIPSSFATIFILLVLMIMPNIRIDLIKKDLLLFLFIFALILTHPITSICLLIILLALYLFYRLYRMNNHMQMKFVSISFILLFGAMMLSWWAYASMQIDDLSNFIKWGFTRDQFVDLSTSYLFVKIIPFVEEIYNSLSIYLFISVSFIGIFYMISKRGSNLTRIFGFVLPLPIIIAFISQIIGTYIIEDRWWYYALILLSIPLGAALFLLINIGKKSRLRDTATFLLIILLAFILIVNPKGSMDNNSLSPNSDVRYTMTLSEMQSLITIHNLYNGSIGGDGYYNDTVMKWTGIGGTSIDSGLLIKDFTDYSGSVILVRNEIVENPFKLLQSIYKLDYDPDNVLENQGFSKIYSSTGSNGYLYTS